MAESKALVRRSCLAVLIAILTWTRYIFRYSHKRCFRVSFAVEPGHKTSIKPIVHTNGRLSLRFSAGTFEAASVLTIYRKRETDCVSETHVVSTIGPFMLLGAGAD